MEFKRDVEAIAGVGLKGDRYANAQGSYNKGKPGKRQVTLINHCFFKDTSFKFDECRRNIITKDVELMWLIGREFKIGEAVFLGVKYCDPCQRPSKLAGKVVNFQRSFYDRGGLVADVVTGGLIKSGSAIIPPKKDY